MSYIVEYGKINCSGWKMEMVECISEAKKRFDEIKAQIIDGGFYATTVILNNENSLDGTDEEAIDFFTTED